MNTNRQVMRGMLWCLQSAEDAACVGGFAERCFRGDWGAKVGNTCIAILGGLPDSAGVVWLTRLRGQVRLPRTRTQIEKALGAASKTAGVSASELEERGIPTFGLGTDGTRTIALAGCVATLHADPPRISWRGVSGRPVKSVPAVVKRDAKEGLAELRRELKEMKRIVEGQRQRLERLFLQRKWIEPDAFDARYLGHPLIAPLVRRLMWETEAGDLFLPTDPVTRPVRMWHPLGADADLQLVWRDRLADEAIQQPFPQLWREIYGSETDRFVGRLCNQRRFAELCQRLDWQYAPQGNWAGGDRPSKLVGELEIYFDVEPVGDTDLLYETIRIGAVHLDDGFDTLTVSELMREIDVLTSRSRTGDEQGPLTAIGKTRADILRRVVERIGLEARVEEPWLTVGDQRIHIGSARPDGPMPKLPRQAKEAAQQVFLPHEGDPALTDILALALAASA